MPADLFGVYTRDELRAALRAQEERNESRNDQDKIDATKLLEGRQLELTEQEIRRRYAERQAGPANDRIRPMTLPLAERYVAEAANAYNKPVKRVLVDESGVEVEEATTILNDEMARAQMDERLHRLEQYTVALDSCGMWSGAKRGKLAGQIVTPQRIRPVLPLDSRDVDPADQSEYLGFVVELERGAHPSDPVQWCLVTPAAHYYYQSDDWSELPADYEERPNTAFLWTQSRDTDDRKGVEATLPLQMLSVWHRQMPVGCLIPSSDIPIAQLNLELNVQWSVLLDTLRRQGWGQLVYHLMDPTKAPPKFAVGSGFAIGLGPDESIESLGHANDYRGMVDTLQSLVRLLAVLMRQSPNDFSLEGVKAQSGFAKLVDSMPKLEAREQRIRRLRSMEEQVLWPRVGSVLEYLGKLKGGDGLRMRTEFADVEFPQSVDEDIKRKDHDIKLGLTTPARLLAKEQGISIEEAEQQIADNKAKQPQPEEKQKPEDVAGPKGLVARLVASQRKPLAEKKDEPGRAELD